MNLLVVDDEIYAIEGIRCLLDWKHNGVETFFEAAGIAQAKELLARESIDLLLCDIELVEENGLDLLQWINEQGYPVKTVFLTCHEVFGYAQRAIQQGAVNYILKPARPEQMLAVLKQVRDLLEKEKSDPVVELVRSLLPEGGREEKSEVLQKLDTLIMEHLDGNLSRNTIAGEMYLNPDYLGRVIKKETGLSLSEYIVNRKILVAAALLTGTKEPIGDIAMKTGFQELSYFFRVFKKEMGVTPKIYRQQYEGKGDIR